MKSPMGFKIFISIVILAVTSVVIVGLYLSGSPQEERMRRFDDQRAQDLQQVSYAVESFWNQNQHLPKTLDELMQGPPQYSGFSIQDPKTQVPYEYRILSASTYELCAVFETDAQTITAKTPQPMPAYAPPGFVQPPAFWQHGIGRTCFPVTVKKSP